MKIPKSMEAELSKWNCGNGVDLETWINGSGNFSLAVGYTTIFWPNFVSFDGYILQSGFSESELRKFESREGITKKTIEWINNHLHLSNIHHGECEDISKDKLVILGDTLKEIYEAKLKLQFPNNPCVVEFYIPEDKDDLWEYQISFWQLCHEEVEK
jgi:hypothetical protein